MELSNDQIRLMTPESRAQLCTDDIRNLLHRYDCDIHIYFGDGDDDYEWWCEPSEKED